jgi:predicted aconitase
MKLTDEERKMLDGDYGQGLQRSMKLLVQWGGLFDAEKMVKADVVHLSTNFATEALREMSEGAQIAKAFTTTHAVYDPKYYREKLSIVVDKIAGGYAETDEEKFVERMELLRRLGVLPTFTCSPYTIGILARPGDVLCMTGSSGQVISNAFFGARAGRESVSTCFAAAMTGKTPLIGLLKKENRYADILAKIDKDLELDMFHEADYGAMGYYLGEVAGPRNLAINGLPSDLTFENGRMLVSPLPVSGACVMCHIIGVTPEANTLEEAIGNRKPEMVTVGKAEIAEAYEKLNDSESREVDMAVIGCPHLTIKDIGKLASLVEGEKVSENLRLVVGAAEPVYTLAKRCGYTDTIESSGGIFVNSCISALNPFMFLKKDMASVAVTNSARAAHYIQRMSGGKTKTFFGDMKKCVRVSITGKWED